MLQKSWVESVVNLGPDACRMQEIDAEHARGRADSTHILCQALAFFLQLLVPWIARKRVGGWGLGGLMVGGWGSMVGGWGLGIGG